MTYIDQLSVSENYAKIISIHEEKKKWVGQNKKGFLRYRLPCDALQAFPAANIDCSGDAVKIGEENEVSESDKQSIKSHLRSFMPWRKGPFSIFGIDVDSEWQSQRKWQRLLPRLPDLQDKVIADIGCSNGYYMFRMIPYKPRLIIGFEPSVQHYYCFKGLNNMARLKNMHIDLLGVEHLSLFPDCFDVLFLMGIIYHRSSPDRKSVV